MEKEGGFGNHRSVRRGRPHVGGSAIIQNHLLPPVDPRSNIRPNRTPYVFLILALLILLLWRG